jgi:methylated-DNA-[protein]-cysteine S-methyltransferase
MTSPYPHPTHDKNRIGGHPNTPAVSGEVATTSCLWDSPAGPLKIVAGERGLRLLIFGHEDVTRLAVQARAAEGDSESAPEGAQAIVEQAQSQLAEYFEGRRRAFSLPLDLRGTEFQVRVWQELCRIDYGTTISYRELAARIGRPAAVRAVGAANGANPISIVVPCHRVIGANGSLTGYGGGLPNKRYLLDLEQRVAGGRML